MEKNKVNDDKVQLDDEFNYLKCTDSGWARRLWYAFRRVYGSYGEGINGAHIYDNQRLKSVSGVRS